MPESEQHTPATVPTQPEPTPPMKKGRPVIYILVGVIVLIGLTNLSSLVSGNKKEAPRSALPMRPSAANPQQVSSFEKQQAVQAQRDQEERLRQQQVIAAEEQAEQAPGPEADGTRPMTPAQRAAIYGDSPNAPKQTSTASQAEAEAKQRQLAREKLHQDAINSDTVAIDFAHPTAGPGPAIAGAVPADVVAGQGSGAQPQGALQTVAAAQPKAQDKTDPMGAYNFDQYQGKLYRVFEGTVLEGVVTNRIDGGFSGPILVMLTTDYYSHDHQQLLMPQGTRLIGTVQSVGNAQQRKMFVTFHRAVCPDGFSLDFDKYLGLDQMGTTGLATKVDHGYLMAFGAAAAIGGLGGLAQIGNNSSILDPSAQIRNGISSQSAQESEQILNHFLNRLPIITLKEGSRARVYIGRDILIPSYADHQMDSTL